MFELAEANEQTSIALENALHLLLILRETLFGEAQEQPETPEELNAALCAYRRLEWYRTLVDSTISIVSGQMKQAEKSADRLYREVSGDFPSAGNV